LRCFSVSAWRKQGPAAAFSADTTQLAGDARARFADPRNGSGRREGQARLAEAGGIAAASPRDVAETAEILITSLRNVDAFEQVMAGQGGIVPRSDSGLGSGGPALN